MRSLTLASKYQNDTIIFAVENLNGNINSHIKYKKEILSSNHINEVQNLILSYKIDMIILDSYSIDIEYEKKLSSSNKNLIIMVIDDIYQKHYCHILINPSIFSNKKDYIDKVPDFCDIRCGGEWSLMRSEFLEKYIFISMGGSDSANLNIKILEVLKNYDSIQINIITTKANKNLDTLIKYEKNRTHINLHIDTKNIVPLIKQSDFAIITPSTILNEVMFMGLDFISIKTASNQEYISRHLIENDFFALESFDTNKLKKAVDYYLKK